MNATDPQSPISAKYRWHRDRAGRLLILLLAMEAVLLSLERVHWFAFSEPAGRRVLAFVACNGFAAVILLVTLQTALLQLNINATWQVGVVGILLILVLLVDRFASHRV